MTLAVDTKFARENVRRTTEPAPQVVGDDNDARFLRKNFLQPINTLARRDIVGEDPASSLSDLVVTMREVDLQLLPICDQDGRIKGLVSNEALLQALVGELARRGDRGDG